MQLVVDLLGPLQQLPLRRPLLPPLLLHKEVFALVRVALAHVTAESLCLGKGLSLANGTCVLLLPCLVLTRVLFLLGVLLDLLGIGVHLCGFLPVIIGCEFMG